LGSLVGLLVFMASAGAHQNSSTTVDPRDVVAEKMPFNTGRAQS